MMRSNKRGKMLTIGNKKRGKRQNKQTYIHKIEVKSVKYKWNINKD